MRLVTIYNGNTIQLVSIKNSGTIDMTSTSKGKVIEEVNSSGKEVDKVDIIDVNNTKFSKSVISKDLI